MLCIVREVYFSKRVIDYLLADHGHLSQKTSLGLPESNVKSILVLGIILHIVFLTELLC